MSLEEAIEKCNAHNYKYRVVYKDGEYFFVTADVRADRINLKVENNIVIAAYIG